MKRGVLIPNSQGLVTTTAGPDLVHSRSLSRNAKIRKIMWYNNTGLLQTLIFGTVDNAAPAGWVPLLPAIACVNGLHDAMGEDVIPDVIWARNTAVGAAGVTGDIWVQASVAGIFLRITVEER